MSQSRSFLSLGLSFAVTGVGTGLANIAIMALLTRWFPNVERGKATGISLGGNSAGIVLAGVLVPYFNRVGGFDGWRMGWTTLGLTGLASAVISGILLRNPPTELNLDPLDGASIATHGDQLAKKRGNRGVLARLSLLYLAFGMTSSVYGAFIVFSMVHEYGLSGAAAGFYWSWMGICSLVSGIAFGALSDRIGRRWGLAAVFGVSTAAYALAGLKLGHGALFISVVLFGFSIFGSVAIVTAAIGDYFEASAVAHALSLATTAFAIGQAAGPIAAGAIASSNGIFTRAYLIAALVTACAALFAFTLPAESRRSKATGNEDAASVVHAQS